jgi:hypothetical protein
LAPLTSATQTPSEPSLAQVRQPAPQASLQQYPSAQNPLEQSSAHAQRWPTLFLEPTPHPPPSCECPSGLLSGETCASGRGAASFGPPSGISLAGPLRWQPPATTSTETTTALSHALPRGRSPPPSPRFPPRTVSVTTLFTPRNTLPVNLVPVEDLTSDHQAVQRIAPPSCLSINEADRKCLRDFPDNGENRSSDIIWKQASGTVRAFKDRGRRGRRALPQSELESE